MATSAERQKAYRSRKRNGVTENVTPVTLPKHDHLACHKELEMLRLDVERLKGELAKERGRFLSSNPPVRTVTEADAALGQRLSREIAKSQNEHKVTVTPHGPRCQGICCRVVRV